MVTGGYTAFRPHVRQDFEYRCAYCLLEELWAGGEENFELDHFRPRSRFPDRTDDFYNLYYACHPCNHLKADRWPTPELEQGGICLVDLCQDDFEAHFLPQADGTWAPLTPSAAYTIDAMRLNRTHLATLRALLAELLISREE